MTFGALKLRLAALINRKDVTDALAGSFVTEAIADLERKLRIGPMERLLSETTWDGETNALPVPHGFLEAINFFTDDVELTQVDLAAFMAPGSTNSFVKIADQWLIKPTPAAGSSVFLHCYMETPTMTADEDTNIWATSAFNAVVYQAAALAADFFQMEDVYAQRFQSRADGYIAAIAEQDHDEKWSGRLAVPLPSDLGDF